MPDPEPPTEPTDEDDEMPPDEVEMDIDGEDHDVLDKADLPI